MTLVERGMALIAQNKGQEAVALLEGPGGQADADPVIASAYAWALKVAGRLEDSLTVYEAVAARNPNSATAQHNVAALLGDLHRYDDSVEHALRAQALGLDGSDTWLVLGRAYMGSNRLREAEGALWAAMQRRPGWFEPLRDLAQIRWMRTGDVQSALAPIQEVIRQFPREPIFVILAAKVEQYAGMPEAALARLEAAARSGLSSIDLEIAISSLAQKMGKAQEALEHAGRVLQMDNGSVRGGLLACDAWLALNQPELAARMAERLHAHHVDDIEVLSRLSIAWRMLGDPRYHALCDYQGMVGVETLDVPSGWPDLASYLSDLRAALKAEHPFEAHPFDQSLRHGSQTSRDLREMAAPAVRALFEAAAGPIKRHLAKLGRGDDPHRRRNTGQGSVVGAWSVWLKPSGFHVDHVHPMGWLSSACYLELPRSLGDERTREGWLKFGEPGVRTSPTLPPERYVRPQPGMLVLFPSYMWHGTVPFTGDERRLTCAFDVVPA